MMARTRSCGDNPLRSNSAARRFMSAVSRMPSTALILAKRSRPMVIAAALRLIVFRGEFPLFMLARYHRSETPEHEELGQRRFRRHLASWIWRSARRRPRLQLSAGGRRADDARRRGDRSFLIEQRLGQHLPGLEPVRTEL